MRVGGLQRLQKSQRGHGWQRGELIGIKAPITIARKVAHRYVTVRNMK